MILLSAPSRAIQQILLHRLKYLDRAIEVDYHLVEFGDVRYHIQISAKDRQFVIFSIAIPPPSEEVVFSGGLPFGAIEAVKASYGPAVQIMDPPESGFQLTIKLDLAMLPPDEDDCVDLMIKIACLRLVVMGAPLRDIFKYLASRVIAPDADNLIPIIHRSNESFFLIPQPEKVTVVFPMHFKDSNDVILATSFLQEFMEARRTAGLNTAPPCVWSPNPPLELKGVPTNTLDANSGFVSFVIFPRHVEGEKLDRTVWSLITFHAYVSYHIKAFGRMSLSLAGFLQEMLSFRYHLLVFKSFYAYENAQKS